MHYKSPKIQKEILKCVGDWVTESILREVRKQPLFSICADEAADSSYKEQIPFVLHCVDNYNCIREDYIVFDEGTSGRATAGKILVCGLDEKWIQRRLLAEADLTFKGAYDITLAMETAEHNSKELQGTFANNVHKVYTDKEGGRARGDGNRRKIDMLGGT